MKNKYANISISGLQSEYKTMTENRSGGAWCSRLKSEKGIALVIVLILSAVSLMLITALLYMITAGTQTSGLNKRYQTALEAAYGGADIIHAVVGLHTGDLVAVKTSFDDYISALNNAKLDPNVNVIDECTGISFTSGSPQTVTGFPAKILTSSSTWNNCGSTSLNADETSYDIKFRLGTAVQFDVYAKVVDVIEGNTSESGTVTGRNLVLNPVVSSGSGELATQIIPYQYTIEVDAENVTAKGERAKLSILYHY